MTFRNNYDSHREALCVNKRKGRSRPVFDLSMLFKHKWNGSKVVKRNMPDQSISLPALSEEMIWNSVDKIAEAQGNFQLKFINTYSIIGANEDRKEEMKMKKTALVIMAAGMGTRFGKGIKQLAPVGPKGEIIMDYSIRDALEAGFNKVVFIIRKDIEEEFRKVIGERIEKITEVAYAFQDMEDIPEGFSVPDGRTKPWGTGHAVLAAKKVLDEPFAVINADDYYGKEAYVKVHDYLVSEQPEDGKLHICMAGFRLGNTLSDNGSVTRGICHIENGQLTGVAETHNIYKTETGAEERREDGTSQVLDTKSFVSMNMWGLTPAFMETLEAGFKEFLAGIEPGDIKKEYLLPELVDRLIHSGKARVDVLETKDEWFGVTYQEDKETVMAAFRALTEAGVYPDGLYE